MATKKSKPKKSAKAKQTSITIPEKEQLILENERLQEKPTKQLLLESKRQQKKRSQRYRIVATFPGFLEYIDKLKKLGRRCKYLMVTGGTSEEVEACVKCVEDVKDEEDEKFGEVVKLSCKDRDDNKLKKEIDEFIKYKDYINAHHGRTGTLLKRSRYKKQTAIRNFANKLNMGLD